MTEQHTPGPWFVTPDGHAVYEKDVFGYRADTICGLPSRSDSRAANARLIAAAPELLTALEALLDRDPAPPLEKIGAVYVNARAAIAKARGQ
jgi:hypothetical protein